MVPPVPMEGFRKDGAVVLQQVASSRTQLAQWLVECSCGQQFIRSGSQIRRSTYLCCKKCTGGKLSATISDHGESSGYLYAVWSGVNFRCFNKKCRGYKNYGGRGITVCEEWRNSYIAFAEYIRNSIGERPTDKHSLDRIDNDGNYEPGNVRWSTASEQMLNRRKSSKWKGVGGRPKKREQRKTPEKLHPLYAIRLHVDSLLGC